MSHVACYFVIIPLLVLAVGCNSRGEEPALAGDPPDGQPSSFVVVNLLDSDITSLVLDYGAEPVQFAKVRIEARMTATRGAIAQLPIGGETLRVQYQVDASAVHHQAVIPPRPAKDTVPVVVLLADGLAVEWRDADEDIFDLSRRLEAKYRNRR